MSNKRILEAIEKLRTEMETISSDTGTLNSKEVVKKSRELDALLNLFENIVKNEDKQRKK